jgi:hypothetical protein
VLFLWHRRIAFENRKSAAIWHESGLSKSINVTGLNQKPEKPMLFTEMRGPKALQGLSLLSTFKTFPQSPIILLPLIAANRFSIKFLLWFSIQPVFLLVSIPTIMHTGISSYFGKTALLTFEAHLFTKPKNQAPRAYYQ